MKKYCVVIGADRISSNQDAQKFKEAGLLGDASTILDIQINMGNKKTIEEQAVNLAFESQYKQLALREWAGKGVNPSNIAIRKFKTQDGALFIVATY